MYILKTNDQEQVTVNTTKDVIEVNNQAINWDSKQISKHEYSVIANNKVYNIFVESIDKQKKTIALNVNGTSYVSEISEPIDQILKDMGIDFSKMQKAEPIKAPMPGLILKILVTEGQTLKKGDPVLILEAMKMENVFKSPTDAVVKSINIEQGQAVEKGQILIDLA